VFPVRYELNSYILFRRNSVFKGLKKVVVKTAKEVFRAIAKEGIRKAENIKL
jgi:hypothetical protein